MGGSLRLVTSQRSASAASVSVGARIGRDGRFEFPNVPPGQYIIKADRGRRSPSTEGEFGALPVSVDGADITGLILQASAGSTIAGRVTFESGRGIQAPRTSQIQIQPVPVDPDQSPMQPADAAIHDDWSFEIAGINGPRRLRVLRAPTGWTLKDIRIRGIDVSDQALSFGQENQSLDRGRGDADRPDQRAERHDRGRPRSSGSRLAPHRLLRRPRSLVRLVAISAAEPSREQTGRSRWRACRPAVTTPPRS